MTDILDTRGLICPLPVLKARKRLMQLPPDAVLTVWADDPRAAAEFRLFCEEGQARLLSSEQNEGVTVIRLSHK